YSPAHRTHVRNWHEVHSSVSVPTSSTPGSGRGTPRCPGMATRDDVGGQRVKCRVAPVTIVRVCASLVGKAMIIRSGHGHYAACVTATPLQQASYAQVNGVTPGRSAPVRLWPPASAAHRPVGLYTLQR